MINTVTGVSVTEMIADLVIADYCERMENHGKRKTIEEIERIEHDLWDGEPTTWKQLCDEHQLDDFSALDETHAELLFEDGKWGERFRVVKRGITDTQWIALTDKGITTPHAVDLKAQAKLELPFLVSNHLTRVGYFRCLDVPSKSQEMFSTWLGGGGTNSKIFGKSGREDPFTKALIAMETATVTKGTGFTIDEKVLDHDDYRGWFTCDECVINAETGERIPHSEAYKRGVYLTKKLGVSRIGQASKATEWLEFITWFASNDPDLVRYLKLLLGAFLVGRNSDQVFYIMQGEGLNGKGSLERILSSLLPAHGATIKTDLITQTRKQNSASNDGEWLKATQAHFVIASESAKGATFDDAIIKQFSGGDTITARKAYEGIQSVRPQGYMMLFTNHLPRTNDTSNGMKRRLHVIPCNAKAKQENRAFEERIISDGEHVMAWILEGAAEYMQLRQQLSSAVLKHPDVVPDCIKAATQAYWDNQDVIGEFVAQYFDGWEVCEHGHSPIKSIYEAYKEWLTEEQDMNRKAESLTLKKFTDEQLIPALKRVKGWDNVTIGEERAKGAKGLIGYATPDRCKATRAAQVIGRLGSE